MKTRKILVSAVLAAVSAGSFAQGMPQPSWARNWQYQGVQPQDEQQRTEAQRQHQLRQDAQIQQQRDGQPHHYGNSHEYSHNYNNGYNYNNQPYANQNRGYYNGQQYSYNQAPHYARGGYVSRDYYQQRRYWVSDWRSRNLYAPPSGYQWVEAPDTGELLLVALATGLIANVIISSR